MKMVTGKSFISKHEGEGKCRPVKQRLYVCGLAFVLMMYAATNIVYAASGSNAAVTFSLYNAQTGKPVEGYDPIAEGAVINLAEVGRELSIVANLNGMEQAGSVTLGYNKSRNFQLEEKAPYAMGLNFAAEQELGVYDSWTPVMGNNEVSAVVYTESKARGLVLGEARISFKVVDEAVEKEALTFSLYSNKTNQPVAGFDPIAEGAVINLAEVGRDLRIVANLKGVRKAESLSLGYKSLENSSRPDLQLSEIGIAAMSLQTAVELGSWKPIVGENTVFATAFSDLQGKGQAVARASVHFEIIDGLASEDNSHIIAYPNPSVDEIHVSSESSSEATFRLVDPAGNVVRSGQISRQQQVAKVDVKNLKNGLYYLQMQTEAGLSTKKIFIRK